MTEPAFRAPAVPLITHDPMFSLWSFASGLADDPPRHWSGARQYLIGVAAIDGALYRFLGTVNPDNTRYFTEYPKLPQISCEIRPLSTVYTFETDSVRLELRFTSPLLPDDLMLLSRPVSYISYRMTALDGKAHRVRLYFGISGEFCVDRRDQEVFFGTTTHSVFVSSGKEKLLAHEGDDIRIEWGTLHVVAPDFAQEVIGLRSLQRRIHLEQNDLKCSRNPVYYPAPRPEVYGPDWVPARVPVRLDEYYPTIVLDREFSLEGEQTGRFALFYDDLKSLRYFGEEIEAYWKKDGETALTLLPKLLPEFDSILKRVDRFDRALTERAARLSPKYAQLLALAYRQAVAGHKLTYHGGELQFVSKENFSNGSAATVDVSYPSMPLFLLYNPKLCEGMLNPIFHMTELGLWPYEFAPHDAGTYPILESQSYGFYLRHRRSTKDPLKKQMPIEECGNMLLCTAAICQAEGSHDYFLRHAQTLRGWADYLVRNGFDPSDQLCTDDFSGHLAHNCNLSLKSICAVAAFGKLLTETGSDGGAYLEEAKRCAALWLQKALDPAGDHYMLAFDQPGSWSIKYNMVWDRLLSLGLFPPEAARREIGFYKTKLNRYGLPLDSRADYTKSDWQLWSTVLTDDPDYFREIVEAMYRYLCETPDRTPFTDFYYTSRPLQRGFQARTVQGGLFLPLLLLGGA